MIAAWMLYLSAVSLLLGLTAGVAERAMAAVGRPLRWLWVGALAGSAGLPIGVALTSSSIAPRDATGSVTVGAPTVEALGNEPASGTLAWFSAHAALLDRPLLIAWGLASLLLAAVLLISAVRLQQRRSAWRPIRIGTGDYLLSRDTGPAVVGLLRSVIVLPAWSLEVDVESRDLLLLHEEEHLRARDPQFLLVGLVLLVLLPWNLPLWWQVHRLRLAMEIDCDSRVLARQPSPSAYGSLLLDVGARRSRGRLAVASFSEPPSFLERRLRMITRARSRRALPSIAAAAIIMTGVLVACGLEQPALTTQPQPTPAPPITDSARPDAPPEPGFTPRSSEPVLSDRQVVRAALEAAYPPALKESDLGGTTVLWVYVDASGRVTSTRVAKSSGHEALDRAAGEVLRQAEFTPAMLDGSPTAVWIQLPVTFRPTEPETGA